jgi:hypothetical protein
LLMTLNQRKQMLVLRSQHESDGHISMANLP